MMIKTLVILGGALLVSAMQVPQLNKRQLEEIKSRKHIVDHKIKNYKVYQITKENPKVEDGMLVQECHYNEDGSVNHFVNYNNGSMMTTYYTYAADKQVTNEVTRMGDKVIQTIVYEYNPQRWLVKTKVSGEAPKEFEYIYSEKGYVKEEIGYIRMGDDKYDGNQWRAQDNIVYTYNDKGQNTKIEYYFFGDVKQVANNEFNADGLISKTTVYNKQMEMVGESNFTYDDDNNLILGVHISPDGNNIYYKYVYEKR